MAARRPAATSTRGAAPALPRAAKPRASRSGSDGVFDPFSAFSLWLFRWRTTGLLIAAAGVALVVLALADRQQLNHLGAPLVRTLGAGVFIVAPVVIGMGVLVFLGRLRITVARLWLTAGWMMAAAVLWGTLSYFRPDWRLAGESIAAVTLGGAVGSAIGRTPLGVLAMTICFVGASLLVWPRFTWWTVGLLPPACRMIASWRIPQRAWRTASEGLRAMFNTGDSEAAPTRRVPSVPEFDDLDVDTTRFVRQQPSAEDDSPPQMPNVNPAAPPAEAKPGKLARLRRGESPRQAAMDLPEAQAVTEVAGAWPRPPRDLLHPGATPEVSLAENESRAHTIVKALASHGVDAQVVSIKQGPTVTQFGVEPGWEVKYRTVVDRDGAGRPVIEKDGRPAAAIVSPADLEALQRLEHQREEAFKVLDRMSAAFADVPEEELEREIELALAEVRAESRAAAAKARPPQ